MADRPHPLAPPSQVTPAVLATVPPRRVGESYADRTIRLSAEKNRWMARALAAETKLRRREIAHRRLLRYVLTYNGTPFDRLYFLGWVTVRPEQPPAVGG